MLAWGAVGLVVVIIVVLVVVKATGGSSNNSTTGAYTPVTPAPASVVNDVTTIPLSVYNKVGRHLVHRRGGAPDRPEEPAAP